MNIQKLNELIPDPYREINVPTTFLYYRDDAIYPVSESYVPSDNDYIFKYKKTNGLVEIEQVEISSLNKNYYTAEEWVSKYFTTLEIIALTRFEQIIAKQGKTLGPKMQNCKTWLETMMFAQPSNVFPEAPHSYNELSIEAAQTISSS